MYRRQSGKFALSSRFQTVLVRFPQDNSHKMTYLGLSRKQEVGRLFGADADNYKQLGLS